MCAVPSRLVFTFSSTFLSFFSLCSSTYFRYTLAFSTGAPFSPPETSIVTRDIRSDLAVCVGALGSDSWAVCAHRPPQSARVANATQTAILICGFMLERNLLLCNLSSTYFLCRSSLPYSFDANRSRYAADGAQDTTLIYSRLRPYTGLAEGQKLIRNLFVACIDCRSMLLYLSESTRQETAVAGHFAAASRDSVHQLRGIERVGIWERAIFTAPRLQFAGEQNGFCYQRDSRGTGA